MPIHLNDLDIVSEVTGLQSALIVPCNMCPAVSVAVREKKPFLQLYRSLLKSAPFHQHIQELQSRLRTKGVHTDVFESNLYHQWFLCIWTSARRRKLRKYAQRYDAVIVLGCNSATETVRNAIKSTGCTVIEGMEISGIMNAQATFSLPGNVSFEKCRIIPLSTKNKEQVK
jgi:hypothetical protein